MIAEAALTFTEGLEVARLRGTQPPGGVEVIEAIPDAFPVTPAPPILMCLLGVAMQPTIDIVQVVGAQPMQNAQLKFMLPGIFEDVVPVPFDVAPGNDLSVLSFMLGCIEVAAEQSWPMLRRSEGPVHASQQVQLEVRIELPTSIGVRLVVIGRGNIDVRQIDFATGTVQQREEGASAPVFSQFLAVGCGASLVAED